MDYIPYSPAYDPLGLALGQGMGQGMMQQGQQQQWQQLLAALSGQPYQGRQGGINLPLLGNIGGRQVNYPATQGMNMQALGGLRDPQMQQMALGLLSQQMQPQQTSVGDIEAQYLMGLPTAQREQILQQKLTRPGVSVTIGSGEREQLAQTQSSIDALNNLKTLFDISGRKTGWLSGRWQKTKGIVEGLNTEEQESFLAATSAFKNQIIKEITGAQLSEQEATRIMEQIPDEEDPPTRWLAKWGQSKNNLVRLQKRRMEIMEKTGADISKFNTISATNPDTGQKIISYDGGKTWQQIK